MDVIGAGLGRTGTMSLKVALEQLGRGPCYHAIEFFDDPERVGLWRAAIRGDPVDWDELLAGYRSTVDWPACSFYAQLADAHPDAQVVLTVRDPQSWYESVATTIYGIHRPGTGSSLFPPESEFPPELREARAVMDELIFVRTFSDRFEDRAHAIDVFTRHNDEVQRQVSPDRLLVYEVAQGWEPLCEFLGVAAPDTPFPHLNDREAFEQLVHERAQDAPTKGEMR